MESTWNLGCYLSLGKFLIITQRYCNVGVTLSVHRTAEVCVWLIFTTLKHTNVQVVALEMDCLTISWRCKYLSSHEAKKCIFHEWLRHSYKCTFFSLHEMLIVHKFKTTHLKSNHLYIDVFVLLSTAIIPRVPQLIGPPTSLLRYSNVATLWGIFHVKPRICILV